MFMMIEKLAMRVAAAGIAGLVTNGAQGQDARLPAGPAPGSRLTGAQLKQIIPGSTEYGTFGGRLRCIGTPRYTLSHLPSGIISGHLHCTNGTAHIPFSGTWTINAGGDKVCQSIQNNGAVCYHVLNEGGVYRLDKSGTNTSEKLVPRNM